MTIKTLTKLAVPKQPDTINVCPALSTWAHSALGNRDILTKHIYRLSEYRNNLVSLAVDYTRDLIGKEVDYDQTGPVIVTGHQPNWHHCGIFIKSLIGHQLAKRLDGLFVHIVVDHDTPDTNLLLPGSIHADHYPDISLEQIKPDPKAIRHFLIHCVNGSPDNALLKSCWADTSHFSNINKNEFSISQCITFLQAVLYQNLNIDAVYLPVSKIAESSVFQDFLVYLLSDFNSFIDHYNHAVSMLKASTGISGLSTKKIQNHSFNELPLWLFTPENNRTSLFVSSGPGHDISIACESEILVSAENTDVNQTLAILKQKGYSIGPKAVVLTLFVRLYLADWFIHGAGGAKYELISDYLLKHFFRIDGLSYGAAALTSFLFENNIVGTKQSLDRLQQKHRAFLHKPESLLDSETACKSELCDLLETRHEAILSSTNTCLSHEKRKNAREDIRAVNRKLQAFLPFCEKTIVKEKSKLNEHLAIFQKRDFFFGLFPEEYLNSFTGEINAQLQIY